MSERIPDEEGVIPPPGHVLVQDQDGDRFWVSPDELQMGPVQSELTQEQIKRVEWCKDIFGASDESSLEETLENFQRDQNPEKRDSGL